MSLNIYWKKQIEWHIVCENGTMKSEGGTLKKNENAQFWDLEAKTCILENMF
jgi:hypothetical protein